MYIGLPDSDKDKKIKKTIFYPNAGVSVEQRTEQSDNNTHEKEMEVLASQTELTYYTAVQQINHAMKKVEEVLVYKISVAVTMSLPYLSAERMEHALFVKKIFNEGEIGFQQYIEKMQNLFPDRMENLSEEIKEQIEQRL